MASSSLQSSSVTPLRPDVPATVFSNHVPFRYPPRHPSHSANHFPSLPHKARHRRAQGGVAIAALTVLRRNVTTATSVTSMVVRARANQKSVSVVMGLSKHFSENSVSPLSTIPHFPTNASTVVSPSPSRQSKNLHPSYPPYSPYLHYPHYSPHPPHPLLPLMRSCLRIRRYQLSAISFQGYRKT